ncbi:hypothetical protein VYU27_007605 [Nannochloropsis oceanica]
MHPHSLLPGCLLLLIVSCLLLTAQAQWGMGKKAKKGDGAVRPEDVQGGLSFDDMQKIAKHSGGSNGKFKSTPHRVLPAVGKERISIPFFFEPNLDTLVEPLKECESFARAQGKVFSPILFADHLRGKVTNNFSFLEPSLPAAAAASQGGKVG